MQYTLALAALASIAYAAPQGVTGTIVPTLPAPAGCSSSYSGAFELQAVNFTTPAKQKRQACGSAGVLTVTLDGGKLLDSQQRTGYIASNFQFQFDGPPQDGAIFTAGFSVCSNGSLALGGSAVFYQCLSGGFYNLYDRSWAAQCNPILLDLLPCGSSGSGVGQSADGQATGTATGAVSQITDGQPQATTAVPKVTQIGDGQIQAPSAVPISQISDGQIQQPTSAVAPISQISDGQVQATPAASKPVAPISQISDGQVQATPAATKSAVAPISQISDGQVQATSAVVASAPISQISDGQIQATTAATKPSAAPISQISDGQIQATGAAPAAPAKSSSAPFLGAASNVNVNTIGSQFAALIAGLAAIAFL